jgi:predicted Zn-dependent peptidase
VYAACLPERFDEVIRVTTDVLADVVRDGITEAECRIAKGAMRGGLVLGLEDSGSRMHRIGRSELNYGEYRSVSSSLEHIEAVTVDEVNAVARQLLSKPMGAAVLGPHRSKRSLPKPLRAVAG